MQLDKDVRGSGSRVFISGLCCAVLTAILTGCAQTPSTSGDEVGQDASAAAPQPHSISPASDADAAPAPLMDLKSIIRLIEAGQSNEALRALKTYLAKDPKNTVALSLQQQLTVNPVAFLGKPTGHYTVQAGDTLGGIAAKFLGNPLKFVILGRYNQINRVKDLRVGQVLKLPANAKVNSAALAAPDAVVKATTVSKPDADTASASHSAPSAAVPAPSAANAPTEPPFITSATPPEAPAATITPAPKSDNAASAPSAAAEPKAPSAAAVQLTPVQMAQVQKYHESALVAYRKQALDKAIALWNKALAIDPNYEPALGYRARAQELQRRLNQMVAH